MTRTRILALSVGLPASVFCLSAATQRHGVLPNVPDNHGRVTLANGWRLTPAGKHIELPGDLPGSMVLSRDGRYLFVNTCGYHGHSLSVIDTASFEIVQKYNLVRDWVGMSLDQSTGLLAISGADDSDYKPKRNGGTIGGATSVPASAAGALFRFHWDGSELSPMAGMGLEGIADDDRYVSGIASLGGDEAIVLNAETDTALRMDVATGVALARAKVGYRPYGVAISPDHRTAAVSNWGDGSVTLLDARSLKVRATVRVDAQPGAVAYSKDGRLFVADSGVDLVSVIRGTRVIEKIRTSPMPAPETGATPSALATSRNGKRLYVADAGDNCVAVVDTSHRESRVLGFIPTGRYPSALALSPDGRRLYVGTAKGLTFRGNPDVQTDSTQDVYDGFIGYSGDNENKGVKFDYVGGILAGHVSAVDLPSAKGLAAYTRQVHQNTPLGMAATVLPARRRAIQAGAFSKIKHILYIIKENRTYDEVLGDDPHGNGDPKLTIFGAKVTPNEHKLVDDYVLFDNLYCDGEVSQVGHQWTDSAYATDYTEKAWVMSYSDRGQLDADTRLSSSPAGFIWNDAARHGKPYRIYGEYMQYSYDHDDAPDMILKNAEKFHFSQQFENVHKAKGRDPQKAQVFIKELRAAERTGKWPALMVMALPEDHTKGLKAGSYSPLAMVGSNDRAVGMIVDAISHSKFWKSTAIFIIEDDAQNGPDHVDAHRTPGLLISPYVRRHFVDHTMYSTSSMLRTMELIFGLPPMTHYDASATPMYAAFTTQLDLTPYSLVPPRVDLNAKNPKGTSLAKRSAMLDFSDDDRADPDEFNAILWAALKPGEPLPPPVHGLRPGP